LKSTFFLDKSCMVILRSTGLMPKKSRWTIPKTVFIGVKCWKKLTHDANVARRNTGNVWQLMSWVDDANTDMESRLRVNG
jgi:hypothetical protein